MTQPQQPAFPTPEGALKAITKREYFAALNYAALIAHFIGNPNVERMMSQAGLNPATDLEAFVAMIAVDGAKALIKELNKPV